MFEKWKTTIWASALLISLGFASSCGNNSSSNIQIPGVQGPNVSLLQDNLQISMVFDTVQIDGGLRYNIPNYKYSFLEISPDLQSNGTLMSISISLNRSLRAT